MTWTMLPASEYFQEHRSGWDRLNHQHHHGHPLLDSRFVGALLEHVGTGEELLAIHHDRQECDAMLILTRIAPFRWALFLPSQAQIAPIVCGAKDVLTSLLKQLPGWALSLDLLAQDEAFSSMTAFPSAQGLAMRIEHALTISIDLTTSFADYWGGRSRSLRQNLGRYLRRATASEPPVRLSVIEAPEQMMAAVTRYGDLESAGWKGEAGTAVHGNNIQGRFYTRVLELFAQTQDACIYEMYRGDQLIASRLCINSSDYLVFLKTTYGEQFSALAPGRLLLYRLLEREFSLKRFKAVEFYTNATPEQISWSTHQRHIYHVTLFRGEWLRVAYCSYQALRRRRRG